ncbi:MAG: sulfite exporter TauE/SafE family protein [Aphanocapsa sp. GSE-SYN-MK-11-07L]|nr:sulfite exporter TauE/SafE family protein [Aphanocapsa sp. GSE-SYN-MK-11-07L]
MAISLFLIGIVTGILSGLLGIGGGLLMVPALTLFGVSLVEATATSLVAVFLSAASGSLQNLRMGDLDKSAALLLAGFGILTAQVGAWLGDRLPERTLALGFAGLLLVTIYMMALKQRLQRRESALPPVQAAPQQSLLPHTAGIGILAGLLSGLFGVGGGVVMVPLQMLLLAQPIKIAVRTSLGAIVVIAISGIVQHSLNNNVLWVPGLCLGMGGIVGAQLGTRLLPKLPDPIVGRMFQALLLGLAVYMLISGLQ